MDWTMIDRLQRSFNLLVPRGPELVDRYFGQLFSKYPVLRPMFPRDMSEPKSKLLSSLMLVMENLRDIGKLEQPLQEMGARHVGYGTTPEHYPFVRDTLISVMADMSGDAWNDQLTQDWHNALDFMACVMLKGAKYAAPTGSFN
jgi:hemoglobin-like flavoprotein